MQTADLRRVKDEIALCRVGSQRYLQAWRKLQLRSCILSATAYKAKRANHGLWILIPKVCIFRRIRLRLVLFLPVVSSRLLVLFEAVL